jgi:hypothetical protein
MFERKTMKHNCKKENFKCVWSTTTLLYAHRTYDKKKGLVPTYGELKKTIDAIQRHAAREIYQEVVAFVTSVKACWFVFPLFCKIRLFKLMNSI